MRLAQVTTPLRGVFFSSLARPDFVERPAVPERDFDEAVLLAVFVDLLAVFVEPLADFVEPLADFFAVPPAVRAAVFFVAVDFFPEAVFFLAAVFLVGTPGPRGRGWVARHSTRCDALRDGPGGRRAVIDVRRWLACPTCGVRGDGGNVCPGCGATRGARVALDRASGDGRWVVAVRGPRDVVLQELGPEPGADADQLARLAAARRVLEGLAPGPVALWLDLRPAAAGAVARKGPSPAGGETTSFVLPWLLVRADGGREARIVRRSQARPRRGQPPATYSLDELLLRGPAGAIRRPLRGPGRLDRVDWGALEADTPPPGPLPQTAPADPRTSGTAPVSSGLTVAALLLVAVPFLLGAFVPEGRAARERRTAEAYLIALSRRVDPDAVASIDTALPPRLAREVARTAASNALDPVARRNGLAAAARYLEPAERRRLLVSARHDVRVEVGCEAMTLLAREGPLGAAQLADAAGSSVLDDEVRAQALRDLIDLAPRLAAAEALHLLRLSILLPNLRGAAFSALAVPGAAADAVAARRMLMNTLELGSPLDRGRAGWALPSVAPVDTQTRVSLLVATGRTLDDAIDPSGAYQLPDVLRAQEVLVGAMLRAEVPTPWLRSVSAHPGLVSRAARRVLDAALRAADAAPVNSDGSSGR